MTGPETPLLCENCPLHHANVDEAAKIQLRDRAAELAYASWPPVEWSEFSDVLERELGVTRQTADFAVECIGKISRKYCQNCDLGNTPPGDSILVPRQ